MTVFALLSLFVLSSVSWTDTDAVYILQPDSKPIAYTLHLEPDIMDNHFIGSVSIDFTMNITTSVLVMNQKDLMIDTVEVEGNLIRRWNVNHQMEILVIYCDTDLMKDHTYNVKIRFESVLIESRYGFYKSSYITGNETRWIAATHFEPTSARLAFPCWDEPIYKAVFDISIKHLSNYTAVISNMPVLNRTYHADDTITTYFERSMPMSTYLVAFVVSDYAYKSHDDDRFKIYTRPDSIHMTDLAYNFSVRAMQALDEYTEIPYFKVNPKMDQVTLRDFNPSAMENWGMCTYREDFILFEEGVSTSRDRDYIITTIAHEFSHQWFGNLVSPTWWEFIWLNEGFANYFQYLITDKVEPTWRYLDLFPVETMQWGAFQLDGKDSRPMNTYAGHPNEIADLFDVISYQKAGCVIRMLSYTLTERIFHNAMKIYLHDQSYSVADSDTLINYLQMAAGEFKLWGGVRLKEIVDSWITQSGFPMVTVNKTGTGDYTLSQQQFLYFDTNTDKKRWWIPITYATNHKLNFTNTSVTHWMNQEVNQNLTISEPNADWILLNKQQAGYYRVNYDDETWHSLTNYLKSGNMHRIHPVNRAQLIDDALTMARTNHTKYAIALSLTLYLNREIDYIPWMTAFKHLEFLRTLLFPSRNYHVFKHYIRYIMHSLTKNVTYVASPKDDHPTKILKHNAMKWACLADVPECLEAAHKEFNAWLKNPNHRQSWDTSGDQIHAGLILSLTGSGVGRHWTTIVPTIQDNEGAITVLRNQKAHPAPLQSWKRVCPLKKTRISMMCCSLDPDLRDPILCTALRTASEEVWGQVLDRLSEGAYGRERLTNPLEVMGCSNNINILHKFLIYSGRADVNIRFETAARAVLHNTNVTGVEVVQYALDYNLLKFMNMPDFDAQAASVAVAIGAVLTDNNDFLRASRFAVTIRASDSVVQSIVQHAMRNMKWIANYGRTVDDWFLDNEQFFVSSGTTKTFMSLLLIFSMFNTMLFKIFI